MLVYNTARKHINVTSRSLKVSLKNLVDQCVDFYVQNAYNSYTSTFVSIFLECYPGSPLNEGGKGEKGRREDGKERRGEHGGRAGERRVREERGLKGKRKRGPQFSFLATPL